MVTVERMLRGVKCIAGKDQLDVDTKYHGSCSS